MLPPMRATSLFPAFLVSFAAILVVGILLWSRRKDKERTEAVRRFARMQGWEFQDRGEIRGLDTWLFKHTRRRSVRNVLTRNADTGPATVFDYRYIEHHGNHSHAETQTVAVFRVAGDPPPEFELRPENVLHKVAGLLGWKDIDFDSHPEFSSKVLLRGPDEAAVRRAFTPPVLSFFERNLGWSVETKGNAVLVYRAGKTAKPDDLAEFVDAATRVHDALSGTRA